MHGSNSLMIDFYINKKKLLQLMAHVYAHFLVHDSEVNRWLIPKQIITDAVKSKNWTGYLTSMNLRIVSKNIYMNLRIRNGQRHYSLASKVKDISHIQGQE